MKRIFFALTGILALASCGSGTVPVEPAAPKLLSIIPKAGYPDTEAVLSGYGFSDDATVSVGGTPADVKSVSVDRIVLVMPQKELGSYPVTVSTGGYNLEGVSFRYAEPVEPERMQIFSYTPNHGSEGDEITLNGQLFSNKKDRNSVTINGKQAEIVSANDSRIVVVLPDNDEGRYPFVVTVGTESVTGPDFTYDKKPELTVLSVTPNTGCPGDVAVIEGLCFSEVPSENSVFFGEAQAEVVEASSKQLSVIVPDHPVGTVTVTVTVGGKTAGGPSFLYVAKTFTYTVRTIAGASGRAADTATLIDGPGETAKFRQPRGLVFLPDGRMVIFDNGNNSLRLMDLQTHVVTSTQATRSHCNAAWRGCLHGDWIYIASKGNNRIVRYNYKTDESEIVDASFTGTSPMDVAFDAEGNGYVLVRDGSKAVFKADGDDFGTLKEFVQFEDGPLAMQFAPDGQLIVTTNGCQVLSVAKDGTITPVAGIRGAKGNDSGEPGQPLTAKFGSNLFGMTVDASGRIYVADDAFKVIRLIAPGADGYTDAVVSVIAGTAGTSGKKDGTGTEAQFGSPGEIRMAPDGKHLYVSEYNHFTIREITIE